MVKRRTTSADRKLQQGRGQGHGETYQPFLTVREVPSKGLSSRIKGWETTRVHHVLSNLEKNFFLVLDWSSLVSDIREQFPLPLEETQAIAERLGIRHPTNPKTKEPVVMTTDFLIDYLSEGHNKLAARAVKAGNDLGNKRTIEKLEIERTYWTERKIDWGIVTEAEIPKALAENVEWVRSALDAADSPGLTPQIIAQIEGALFDLLSGNTEQPLSHAALEIDRSLGLNTGLGLWVVRHLIASRQWKVDMMKRINPSKPLDFERVAESVSDKGRA